MSDTGYNIWGVITGTLGFLTLLPIAWIYARFPSRRIHAVEKFMVETTALFDRGLNEGLHTDDTELLRFCIKIWSLNRQMEELQLEVSQLSTWHARVRGCWNGVTTRILSLQGDVQRFHKELIDSSSRNRKRLTAAGYAQGLAKLLSAQNRERQMSIMSLAVLDGRSVSPKHLGVDEPYPQRECSPTPLPQTPLPQSPSSHTPLTAPLLPQMGLPQERLPEMPPYPHSSRNSGTSLDTRCDCRAARRDVLCQYARQLCRASVTSPCTYEGFPLLPLARHRIRFKELIEELARIMDEAAREETCDEGDDEV